MAGEWRHTTLDQLGRIVTGKTPPSSHPDYFNGDIPFVTPSDFDGRRSIETTGRYLTEKGANCVSARIPACAVMISCIGSDMGKAAISGRDCITNQQINSILIDEPNSFLFVYYNLSTRKEEIRGSAGGSAQPILNKSAFGRLEILLPPPAEQRAIAHILGTLDDKIELNRKISKTLEEMARALFKSWFVDFDPVRAKMDGRWQRGESLPGLPAHLYDLFPARLVDSELGKIPEGWEVSTLPALIDVNPPRTLRKSQIAPYLDMANMPTCGHAPNYVVPRAFNSGMRFANGDTLIARITPCLENGKTAFVDFLNEGQVGWGSTEYIILRPKPPLPEEYAYCLARSNEFREFAIQSMTGSSGRQRVPTESFVHYKLAVAPKRIAREFGRCIKPLFARSSAAVIESRTLSALLDMLLPKLISGELRLMDAEKLVETVF